VHGGERHVHWIDFSFAVSLYSHHIQDISLLVKIALPRASFDTSETPAQVLVEHEVNIFRRSHDKQVLQPVFGLKMLVSKLWAL
jgi:hypothetical protein